MTTGEKLLWVALYNTYGGFRSIKPSDYDRMSILNQVYLDIVDLKDFAQRMENVNDQPYMTMLSEVLED